MTAKKTTQKKITPAYNEDMKSDPLMEMKVKKVDPDKIPPLEEKSETAQKLEILEKEMKDIKSFIFNHFGIRFVDRNREMRG